MEEKSKNDLPLFVVAGMPRGATTFLYHYLAQHPEIYLPFRKEVNYFCSNYDRGEDWYLSLYKDMPAAKVAGDISPPCFLDEHAIARIKQFGAQVKVILVVRNPAEWAVSFYHQFKSIHYDVPDFESYLKQGYSSKIGDKYLTVHFLGNWISERIKAFQYAFGDNILIYDFTWFKMNPLLILQHIERFLGVSAYFTETNFDNLRINESKRRNLRFLSWLLSREWFISFIARLFPKSLIRNLRSAFDRLSAKTSGESSKQNSHDEQEIALAMDYLAEEVKRVECLFQSAPVLIGKEPVIGTKTQSDIMFKALSDPKGAYSVE